LSFIEEKVKDIAPLDSRAMAQAEAKWDMVAKPIKSLGKLENMVTQIAGIQQTAEVKCDKKGVLVLAADNGVLAQGVAATPQDVTAIMTGFIAQKRSSVCRMAQSANAETFAVDMGMATRIDAEDLLDCRIADGTADFTLGSAMTREQAEEGIKIGIELVKKRKEEGFQILATGEMGIGNTTTSSAVAAVLLGKSVEEVTGRGAGLSDEGLLKKIAAINKSITVNNPNPDDPIDVLAKLGGFDIAGMVGIFIGGAKYRMPIVVDGLISAVSALVATRICPGVRDFMLASHVTAEPAGIMVLEELGLSALIHAEMRLGEGTGAVALFPILDMALAVYDTACTYADIGMGV